MKAPQAATLAGLIDSVGSPVCVGLDPVFERIPREVTGSDPAERFKSFSNGVLEAVRGVVPAVKFQSACYERFGWRGVRALEESMARARELGLAVILDAKRGDIGISAEHYAAAASNAGAHFVTVNGYLGSSGIQPFLERGLGVFVLVRTSNPDSSRVQSQILQSGGTVSHILARLVEELGRGFSGGDLSDVGAVVGATQSAEGQELRTLMPDQIFLIPGFGSQGGSARDILPMRRKGHPPARAGVLATASRSVLYPPDSGSDWKQNIRDAARRFADEVRAVLQ